jgi:RNA polymerase sigma factor (sigma-70 family)
MVDRAGGQQDWFSEALLLSHLETIERAAAFIAARHHLATPDAEDFVSHVKLKLIEHDYAILRKFQGRSSLRTYLVAVIQKLFLDYRIAKWGKWRSSAEAQRLGPLALHLERLLVRDGYTFDEAFELLTTNHRVTAARDQLLSIAERLPRRTRRRFETDDTLGNLEACGPSPDAGVFERDRGDAAERVGRVLNELVARLEPQDRLIIVMRYADGRTVADIAAALGVDPKALYRRFDRLLRELRSGFEAAGVDATSVMDILESPAVEVDWTDVAARSEHARPSMTKGAPDWR